MIKIYPNTKHPKRDVDKDGKDIEFSVEVFAVDYNDLIFIPYYDYESKRWCAEEKCIYRDHTLKPIDFVWMYKPKELKV